MDNNTYNLIVGIVLVITSLIFFVLPAFLPYDPMLPVLLAIVSLIGAISFFYRGRAKKDNI